MIVIHLNCTSSFLSTVALDECPDQRWFHIEGDCFLFILEPRATFQDAQITCQAQHPLANLAKINPEDPKYVRDFLYAIREEISFFFLNLSACTLVQYV